jgi:hypothetical protein
MIDVGQLLSDWQDRLALITRNANDLFEAEYSKRIRNRLRDGRYAGSTAERAGIAVRNLTALMDDYLVLARVIEEAAEANRGSFFEAREVSDDKVLALLEGPSVALPSVHVPLPKRDLLTQADAAPRATPAELLAAMQDAFAEARDILAAIDAAEIQLATAMDEMRRAHAGLRERAQLLGAAAELAQIDPLMDGADPLRTAGLIAARQREMAAWTTKLDELAKQRDDAVAGVEAAKAAIGEIEASLQLRNASIATVREVFGVEPTVIASVDEATLAELRNWVASLDKVRAEQRWPAVLMGLKRLDSAIATARATADKALKVTRSGLDEMDDLRARFKALRFKAQALHKRSILDVGELDALERAISAGFKARPVVLRELHQQVKDYERRLLGK